MKAAPKTKIRKAAPAAKKSIAPNARYSPTSKAAKLLSEKYGDPNERLRARLEFEAKQQLKPLKKGDELLRLREAARRLGISHLTLRQWALAGKVAYRRLGGLLLMIPASEVERIVNTHTGTERFRNTPR